MQDLLVFIALGSNLGDRRANLEGAIRRLRDAVAIKQLSSVYETAPAYVVEQPRFLNMVLCGTTSLAPAELLQFLKQIEQAMGREPTVRYGPRLIDLDILLYGDLRVDAPDLQIPHPRIAERLFVLVPLAEIAPELRLPGESTIIAELAAIVAGQGEEPPVRVSELALAS